ncbi:MAG: hypothetical protein CMC35_04575 [Flavobacteriaceae bacterium]|nr:hypothetical protein [Flavobacteriaceae bacterium]|tara:strand:+ start:55 stop:273 length:219 start_codon:yes stop_codon:yes gene_type:complete
MKRIVLTLALASTMTFAVSCRETTEKEVIREVEVETTDDEDAEGILERTAKEVDKEVNEEINEEIDKIGNDD